MVSKDRAPIAPTRWLLLWDIDGTLISELSRVREFYAEAARRVIGGPYPSIDFETHGRTELEILFGILERAGWDGQAARSVIPPIVHELESIVLTNRDRYQKECTILPEVPTILTSLSEREGILNSVATGNTRRNAHMKLAAFGLASSLDLDVGAFGDESADRVAVIRLAIERARLLRDVQVPQSRVLVIGDTPRDVSCARFAGTRVMTVATGEYSLEELRSYGPDLLAPSLADGADVLRAFLNANVGMD